MSDDKKTYTDEEFALVLQKAAELARESDAELSLDDMKAIAEEAGLDPVLVERAARSGILVDRPAGGLVKRRLSAFFPITLTKERTTHLLTVIRAATEQQGVGEATSSGLVWRSSHWGNIVVTAHNDGAGCRVQLSRNRFSVLVPSGLLGVLAGWMTAGLNEPITFGVFIASVAVGLGVTFGPWAVTAKRARRRMDALLETIARTMTEMRDEPKLSEGESEPDRTNEASVGEEPDGGAS